MPIITKPALIEKGVAAELTLDKAVLALHPFVLADEYFSSSTNWQKIHVKFKSSIGGQFEIVEFDATLASPVGRFFVSEVARDVFEIEKITIIDFDNGILIIPRDELTVAEFDIDFGAEPPEINEYSFSPSIIPTGVLLSNNNLSVERTQGTGYVSVPVIPSILLNSGKRVYLEFTVDSVIPGSQIAFGVIFRDNNPTSLDLVSPDQLPPGGKVSPPNFIVVRDNCVFVSTNIFNYDFGNITNGSAVGIGLDLTAETCFVTLNGVKKGADFSFSSAINYVGAKNVDRLFFAVGPKAIGEKFTIKESPTYTLPNGYEYIGHEAPEPLAVVYTPVDWQESYNEYSSYYSFEPDGGLITTNPSVSYTPSYYFFNPSAFQISTNIIDFTSNFEVSFEVNPDFIFSQFVVGLTNAVTPTNLIGISSWSNTVYFHVNKQTHAPQEWDDANSPSGLGTLLAAETEKKIKIKKTGSLIEFYMGTTAFYSNTLSVAPTGNVKIVAYGSSPNDYFKGFASVSYVTLP
jgi:hypothetical protein